MFKVNAVMGSKDDTDVLCVIEVSKDASSDFAVLLKQCIEKPSVTRAEIKCTVVQVSGQVRRFILVVYVLVS